MRKLAIAIAAACVAALLTWRLADGRHRVENQAAVAGSPAGARQAARPPSTVAAKPAPPRFTPLERPNNDWDKEARQQLQVADDQEAITMAALDALGPKIGPTDVVEALRRWNRQAFALRRAIFADPVLSEADLELRWDRVRKLSAAQSKAEERLLGLDGFNRWRYLRRAHEIGMDVTDGAWERRRARKPGQTVIGVKERFDTPPIDSREYDQFFTQR